MLMPKYFFNVYHDGQKPDFEGEELLDSNTAWHEATVTAGKLIQDMGGRLKPGQDWLLEVTDEFAQPLYVIHLHTRKLSRRGHRSRIAVHSKLIEASTISFPDNLRNAAENLPSIFVKRNKSRRAALPSIGKRVKNHVALEYYETSRPRVRRAWRIEPRRGHRVLRGHVSCTGLANRRRHCRARIR